MFSINYRIDRQQPIIKLQFINTFVINGVFIAFFYTTLFKTQQVTRIRTHGTILYFGFQNQHLRPLDHSSTNFTK